MLFRPKFEKLKNVPKYVDNTGEKFQANRNTFMISDKSIYMKKSTISTRIRSFTWNPFRKALSIPFLVFLSQKDEYIVTAFTAASTRKEY